MLTAKSMFHNGCGLVALYNEDVLFAVVTHNNNVFHYNVQLALKAAGLPKLRVVNFGGSGDDYGRVYSELTDNSFEVFMNCLLGGSNALSNGYVGFSVAYY